jgi:dihydrodipicolinate synthase/N-acetylneuraminate lyase
MLTQDSKKHIQLQGVAVAAVTPLDENFQLREKELRRHTRFLAESGIDILISSASLGECYALTTEERKRVMNIVADELPESVPLVVCVNHTNMDVILELSKYASRVGAHAVILMPPYYRKLSEKETLYLYQQLSDQLDIGVFLYNKPSITQIDMSRELLQSLAKLENVVALKDCTSDLHKLEWTIRVIGQKISVFNGLSEGMEPYGYIMGASGFVSIIGNFIPKVSVKLRQACLDSNFQEAQRIHKLIMPIVDFMSASKERQPLSVVKQGVDFIGFDVGKPRPPLAPLNINEKKILGEMNKKVNAEI